MAKSCVITPRLKGGEISPLYLKLKEYFKDRGEAIHWYTKAKSTEFSKAFPDVKIDSNNEPVFEDLLEKCGLSKVIDEHKVLTKLKSEYELEASNTYDNTMNLQEKASEFNRTSVHKNLFSAVVEDSGGKIKLKIKSKRDVSPNIVKEMAYNVSLNRKLEKLLNSWNIGIGHLSKLEERLNLGGVTDFSLAKKATNGIKTLIRLAKGIKGTKVLSEEFSHFAIEAMGDNPLKARVLNTLKNEKALKAILGEYYEDYYSTYNGNMELLANEALGKIMAKVLNDANVFIPNQTLFDRYLNTLKSFYSQFDDQELSKILDETTKEVYQLANNIVNNRYKIDLNNVHFTERMANFSSKVDREDTLLKRIIEQELKRLKIYGRKEEFNIKQSVFVGKLETSLKNHQSLDGIMDYISNSKAILTSLGKRLMNLEDGTMQERFKTLRNIKNYISSYGVILSEIRDQMNEATLKGDNRLRDKIYNLLNENLDLIGALGSAFYTISKEEFAKFISDFTGNDIIEFMRDGEKKQVSVKEMLDASDSDISMVDMWLDSMADSSDPIIQIYDNIVKKQKADARNKTTEIIKQIQKETIKLEQAGITDTSFVYERDKEGNVTGYFIQPVWWSEYYKEKDKFFKSLQEKYGDNPTGADLDNQTREIALWYKENTVKNKDRLTVPNSKYRNPNYDKLSQAEKDYVNFITSLKQKLDIALPNATSNLAPQIRKRFAQRLLQNNNKLGYTWETIKDSFVVREDDLSRGNSQNVLIDFEGNEVMRLPIYFTKKIEDTNDLSLDAASSMMAYAYMAVNFDKMNSVIDALEVGRTILQEREVGQKAGNKAKQENFTILGRKITNPLNKKGNSTRFIQKLNTLMEMQVYDMQMKDEGTVYVPLVGKTNIDVGKAANALNTWTSLGTTAVSLLTGLANLTQNWVTSNIEASSKQFFNMSELLYADKEYFIKNLASFVGEIGKRVKTNKIDLFDEKFNVMQDFQQNILGAKMDRKNRILRLFNMDTLYFFTHAGDHYSQNRVAIALAKRYEMRLNGQKTNLWEVLETRPIDASNPALGYTLEVKEGATKPDGTAFTEEDSIKFQNLIRGIQNRLFGIYNSQDKNALQQYAAGRLVMMYRNWMRPLYLTRFGKGTYNYDLQDYVEGYYRTFGRVLHNIYKDLRQGQFDLGKLRRNLSSTEKANLRKATTELTVFISLYILIEALGNLDDDKERPWELRLLNYSLLRLRTDMGALMPTPLIIEEGQKLLEDPFAAVSTLGRIVNLFKLLNPESYTKEIQGGRYDGFTVFEKVLIDLLPFRRAIVNALDPEEPAKWYRQ